MVNATQVSIDRAEVVERIWHSMADTERLSRYYGRISDTHQKWHLTLSLLAILSSVGAAGTLLVNIHIVVTVVLFWTVTCVTSLMLVFDFSRKSETARITSRRMRSLFLDLRDLWANRADEEIVSLHRKSRELEERLNADTSVDLIVNQKLNEQCAEEAYSVLEAELNGNGGARRLSSEAATSKA